MFINYNISEIISQLSSAIHYDESIVKNLPDGKLNCTHNGRYIKWFLSDGNNISYIHKKDRQLASKLALKKFLLSRIEDNKRLLSTYKQCNSTNIQSELLLKDNDFRKLLTDYPENSKHIYCNRDLFRDFHNEQFQPVIDSWLSEEYNHNEAYPQALKHPCPSGNVVRSKSEAMIDLLLNQYGIPYRYECELKLDNISFYPDFTLFNPVSGQLVYWEHFGMMDDPQYSLNASRKISRYIAGNIIPGINLIMTFETSSNPLSGVITESKIEEYLLICNNQQAPS